MDRCPAYVAYGMDAPPPQLPDVNRSPVILHPPDRPGWSVVRRRKSIVELRRLVPSISSLECLAEIGAAENTSVVREIDRVWIGGMRSVGMMIGMDIVRHTFRVARIRRVEVPQRAGRFLRERASSVGR